jgi:hypothetical protein
MGEILATTMFFSSGVRVRSGIRVRFLTSVVPVLALLVVPASSAATYDFDGDGAQELVVGAPEVTDEGVLTAGVIVVVPSSELGLSLDTKQVLSQGSVAVPGVPETHDRFGGAVAGGDFNGDGFDDLAVGSDERFGEQPEFSTGEGAVTVLYGGVGGLTGTGATEFGGVLLYRGDASYSYLEGSGFGATLAAADFDADGFFDLAVTAAGEGSTPTADVDSGVVHLLFGGPAGLSRDRERTLRAPVSIRAGFGNVLATGDIDRDGHIDLIEGAAGDGFLLDLAGVFGHLSFCGGAPTGPMRCRLVTPRSRTYARGAAHGRREAPASLAVADVTGDGYPDIVEGVPENRWWDENGATPPAGAVIIRRGTSKGPHHRKITITQNSPRVPGTSEPYDRFGQTIAVGHLDGDRYADIVVAARGEDTAWPRRLSGRITVIRGGRPGFAGTRNTILDRKSRIMPKRCLHFPSAMTLLDLDGDDRLDLTVGGPCSNEKTGGALVTFFGGRRGLGTSRAARLDAARIGLTTGRVGNVIGR